MTLTYLIEVLTMGMCTSTKTVDLDCNVQTILAAKGKD